MPRMQPGCLSALVPFPPEVAPPCHCPLVAWLWCAGTGAVSNVFHLCQSLACYMLWSLPLAQFHLVLPIFESILFALTTSAKLSFSWTLLVVWDLISPSLLSLLLVQTRKFFSSVPPPPSDPPVYGPLCPQVFEQALRDYPDCVFVASLIGMLSRGVMIGFEGNELSLCPRRQLSFDHLDQAAIDEGITQRIETGGIQEVSWDDAESSRIVCCPIFAVPKAGGKRRVCNNLSLGGTHSVNGGIPKAYGTLRFDSIDVLFDTVRCHGRYSWLWKEDLTDAFCHFPISACHQHLMGFVWMSRLLVNLFTGFGLVTAVRLFNYIAEAFHWDP